MKRTFTVAFVLTTGACSLVTSLDGYTAGSVPHDAGPLSADATVDATVDAPSDGAPSVDAGDDSGLPNLHPNGTFETTTDPWGGFQGTIALDPTAHSGAHSLRVCVEAGVTSIFTADDNGAPGAPTVGATYKASAWVRSAPGAAVPSGMALNFRTCDRGPPFVDYERASQDVPLLDDTWRYAETTLMVTKAAPVLNVYVGGDASPGACFLVDDVTVVRLP